MNIEKKYGGKQKIKLSIYGGEYGEKVWRLNLKELSLYGGEYRQKSGSKLKKKTFNMQR